MASIRCAHCKETHGSVAEVRACAQGTGTVKTAVGVAVGSIVILHSAPGVYWEVDETTDGQGTNVHVHKISKSVPEDRWVHEHEVAQHWPTLQAAADAVIADQERQGAAQRAQVDRAVPYPGNRAGDPLRPEQGRGPNRHLTALRDQVQVHLHREERQRQVGYFALLDSASSAVKFYRLRTGKRGGKWASFVFIDAQASDDYWPVKDPRTATQVLEGILADPEAAALLYATELGRCCRCNRTLTDETSRERGIGPECFKKDH